MKQFNRPSNNLIVLMLSSKQNLALFFFFFSKWAAQRQRFSAKTRENHIDSTLQKWNWDDAIKYIALITLQRLWFTHTGFDNTVYTVVDYLKQHDVVVVFSGVIWMLMVLGYSDPLLTFLFLPDVMCPKYHRHWLISVTIRVNKVRFAKLW